DRALELDPTRETALEARATVLIENHEFRPARELARSLVTRMPEAAASWALVGDAELELGNYDAAAAAYQHMLDRATGLPGWSRVAYLRWLHGDIEGSLAAWDDAIAAGSPQDPAPLAYCLVESGNVSWHAGRLDRAVSRYTLALTVLPNHAGALFGRGRVRFAT